MTWPLHLAYALIFLAWAVAYARARHWRRRYEERTVQFFKALDLVHDFQTHNDRVWSALEDRTARLFALATVLKQRMDADDGEEWKNG